MKLVINCMKMQGGLTNTIEVCNKVYYRHVTTYSRWQIIIKCGYWYGIVGTTN
jgi:hypothetical protein